MSCNRSQNQGKHVNLVSCVFACQICFQQFCRCKALTTQTDKEQNVNDQIHNACAVYKKGQQRETGQHA